MSALIIAGCSGNDEPARIDCTGTDLAIVSQSEVQPTDCTGNGSITVLGSGGKVPYKYALNTGTFGTNPEFSNLAAGDYTLRVKDKNGCEASVEVSLQLAGENPLAAESMLTSDTECFTNNGSITVAASGGQEPYQYKLGSSSFGTTASFNGLAPGIYSVSVKDALDCIFVKSVTITKGNSNTSLANDVRPIIEANCVSSECHGGGRLPNLATASGIQNNAAAIKRETQSGDMPRNGSLSAEEKALIACWVDEGGKNN
jgi:SprB repeat